MATALAHEDAGQLRLVDAPEEPAARGASGCALARRRVHGGGSTHRSHRPGTGPTARVAVAVKDADRLREMAPAAPDGFARAPDRANTCCVAAS